MTPTQHAGACFLAYAIFNACGSDSDPEAAMYPALDLISLPLRKVVCNRLADRFREKRANAIVAGLTEYQLNCK